MPTILCVDDEPKNLVLLEALLALRSYEVILAERGQTAVEKAIAEPPQVLQKCRSWVFVFKEKEGLKNER